MIRTIGIVSLSRGILGEGFMHHELDIGVKRLQDYGVRVKFLPHALDGLESLAAHPEHRAQDLLDAFRDPEIDAILCAIGGDDTYRLAPYLFSDHELQRAVSKKPFLGFSDTTLNHFMLHKVGLPTFYGQAFLPDVCELAPEMLPYTRQYLEEFLKTGTIREVRPSSVWYESRKEFGPDQVGTELPVHKNTGFALGMIHRAAPGFLLVSGLANAANGFRNALTNVILLRYAVNAAQTGTPFSEILTVVLVCFVLHLALSQIVNFYSPWNNTSPYYERNALKVRAYVERTLMEKARSVDLAAYEDPEAYNAYFKAL